MTKSKNLVKPKNQNFSLNSKNTNTSLGFFTHKARLVFIKLK